MAEIVTGSRFAPQVGYGDTSSLQSSSMLPGDKPKYSPVAAKLRPLAPVDVKAAMVNTNRTISAAPLATRIGRSDRHQEPAKIPDRSHRPIVKPGAASRFKR